MHSNFCYFIDVDVDASDGKGTRGIALHSFLPVGAVSIII